MIGGLWKAFKVISGFVSAYKWILGGAAIASLAATAFIYVGNHGEMKVTITSQEGRIAQLIVDNKNLDWEVGRRNIIIETQSALQRQLIAEAAERVDNANKAVEALLIERSKLSTELGEIRFELLEAIRDDENFADWVDWPVPIAGWRLLRSASEGD